MSMPTVTSAPDGWGDAFNEIAFHAIVDAQPDPEPVFRRRRVGDWVAVNSSVGRRRTRTRTRTRERGTP